MDAIPTAARLLAAMDLRTDSDHAIAPAHGRACSIVRPAPARPGH
jgi:hypothetical protein